MEKVDEDASLEFKWLKRRRFGGKKKEVQFYESFIYDGVKYTLYDCVYMYKEGLREPYIGKLIRIWEVRDNKTKKVKVQWFFRPEEITKWLGNTTTLKNEIFFASGEGVGLANVNPLETIAGRCNVVCVSKDPRNPQPSDEELKAADFVFYRTFDVKSCSILDKMEEKVGGLEIEYVFNRKEGENTSTIPGSNQNTTACGEVHQPLDKSLTNKLKDDKEDIKLSAKVDTKGESQDKDISKKLAEISKGNSRLKEMAFGKDKAGMDKVEAKERNKPSTGSDKVHDQPSKKVMPDNKNPPKETQVEIEDMPSKESKVDKSINLPVNRLKASATNGSSSEMRKINSCNDKAVKINSKLKDMSCSKDKDDKLHDRPLKKIKSDEKAAPREKQVELEAVRDAERLKDMPSKKSKVENSRKLPVDGNSKHGEKLPLHAKNEKDSRKSDKDEMRESTIPVRKGEAKEKNKAPMGGSDNLHDRPLKKMKSDDKTTHKEIQVEVEAAGEAKGLTNSLKTTYEEFVVGPKPNAEKSGWFRKLPWEEKLKNAYEVGTAVLLYNVDPNYTSREVEDIIWHALAEHCAAKILQRTAVSSPHYGQALILLKSKDAARRVLAKLDEECLMLSNGRPLVATTCPRILLKRNSSFLGHLAIDKIRLQNQRPTDEAVSTSHFSQPNTIEYDLAMEWCLLQSRSKKWWELIHKQQGDELRKLKTPLLKK